LLDDILSDLQGDITKANADIRVGNIPDVTGNKVQIRMLLQNLISNALKFSDPSRTPIIEISGRVVSSSSYKQFELSIRDNGIGIAEEFQERVFGLFTRLHDYSAYQGSGIGLAVCQRVVNNHGGQIELTSQEGKGTTFKVVFPV
jgi:signal transduction histidine kinase